MKTQEITNKIEKYVDKMFHSDLHDKKIPCGNAYYFYTEDMEGNITGEAYGHNLFLNQAMNQLKNNTYRLSAVFGNYGMRYIAVGTGTTPPTYNDTNLESIWQTLTTAMNKTSEFTNADIGTSASTSTPFKYDSTTNQLYRTFGWYCGLFDYNYDGVENDVELTEFGIYVANNSNVWVKQLITRALFTDDEGNTITITKRSNERMYCYVYIVGKVDMDFVDDIYADNDNRLLFNPSTLLPFINWTQALAPLFENEASYLKFGQYYSYYRYSYFCSTTESITCYTPNTGSLYVNGNSSSYSGYRYKYLDTYTTEQQSNVDDDPTQSKGIINQAVFEYPNYKVYLDGEHNVHLDYLSLISDWWTRYNDYNNYSNINLNFRKALKLPTSDTIIADAVYTDGHTLYFNRCFGYDPYTNVQLYSYPKNSEFLMDQKHIDGRLPITDCEIQKVEQWNHYAHQYEEVSFINGTQKYCVEDGWNTNSSFYHNYNGDLRTWYVYQNPRYHEGYPITGFAGINTTQRMFAAEKWWDDSTWKEIDDLASIADDPLYNDAKFYITSAYNPTTDIIPKSEYGFSLPSPSGTFDGANYIGILFPIRKNVTHPTLNIGKREEYELYSLSNDDYENGKRNYPAFAFERPLSNDTDGWIVMNQCVVYPDTQNPNDDDRPYIYFIKYPVWNGSTFVYEQNDYNGNNYSLLNYQLYYTYSTCARYQYKNKVFFWLSNNCEHYCLYIDNSWAPTIADNATPSYVSSNINVNIYEYFVEVNVSSDPTIEPTVEAKHLFPDTEFTQTQACDCRCGKYVTVSDKGYALIYFNNSGQVLHQRGTILNLDDTDHPIPLSNVYCGSVIFNTNKCAIIYTDNNLCIHIVNMDTNTSDQDITLSSSTYSSITNVIGWNSHLYICGKTTSNENYCIHYDLATGTETVMTNYGFTNRPCWLFEPPYATDDYMIWTNQSNHRPMIVYDGDPTNFSYLELSRMCDYQKNYAEYHIKMRNCQFKETPDHKHLILTTYSNTCDDINGSSNFKHKQFVIDLGYFLDNHSMMNIPTLEWPVHNCKYNSNFQSSTSMLTPTSKQILMFDNRLFTTNNTSSICGVLYKDRVIWENKTYSNRANQFSDTKVYSTPVETFLGYRITTKTKTIQAWNNPRELTISVETLYQYTNNMTKKIPFNKF